jgi:hypothetical protein
MLRTAFLVLGIIAASASLEASASAAEVQSLKGYAGKAYLLISGKIEPQDVDIFAATANATKADTVILDSPGGSVNSALAIGRLIRSRGMSTVVTRNSYCVSACGLIWVAGTRRILTPGARVGFHATYTTTVSMRQLSGVGNALIGRYLTQLNLPERAVVFATNAGPENLNWLSADNKAASGIDLETVDSEYISQKTVAAAPEPSILDSSMIASGSERLAFQKQ